LLYVKLTQSSFQAGYDQESPHRLCTSTNRTYPEHRTLGGADSNGRPIATCSYSAGLWNFSSLIIRGLFGFILTSEIFTSVVFMLSNLTKKSQTIGMGLFNKTTKHESHLFFKFSICLSKYHLAFSKLSRRDF
jgi:hypothetical protein